jgi:hypothetical protein
MVENLCGEFNYDCRQDGTMPPPRIREMLESPAALRARAAVRQEIARQDRAWGDTWAERRNEAVAAHMLNRAAAAS